MPLSRSLLRRVRGGGLYSPTAPPSTLFSKIFYEPVIFSHTPCFKAIARIARARRRTIARMIKRLGWWPALVLALLVALAFLWRARGGDEAQRAPAVPVEAGPADAHDAATAPAPRALDGGNQANDAPSDVGDAADGGDCDDASDGDDANDGGEAEGLDLTLDSVTPNDRCVLRATAQGIVATCDRRPMACAPLARGELTPDPGEELVARCDYAGGPIFLALSTTDAVCYHDGHRSLDGFVDPIHEVPISRDWLNKESRW